MHKACAETFAQKLSPWQALTPTNRLRLATALCRDDRVFWPFSNAQSRISQMIEDRARPAEVAGPMTIGLIGATDLEKREVVEALNKIFYLHSKSTLDWNGNYNRLRNWRQEPSGGLFGGVILADRQAQLALDFFAGEDFGGYILVVTETIDPRGRIRATDAGNPIHWVNFEPPKTACEGQLRYGDLPDRS
jgi:hypothetical protein